MKRVSLTASLQKTNAYLSWVSLQQIRGAFAEIKGFSGDV
jgi:hypothetical protein